MKSLRLTVPLVAVFLLALAFSPYTSPARAEVIVNEQPNQYFSVRGSTEEEIGRSLRSHLGHQEYLDNEPFLAWTGGQIEYRVDFAKYGPNGLRIRDVTVTLDLQYMYPRWEARGKIGPDLARKWKLYQSFLMVHEELGHGKIFKETAAELERTLFGLDRSANALKLRKAVEAVFTIVWEKGMRRHEAFDAQEDSTFPAELFLWKYKSPR